MSKPDWLATVICIRAYMLTVRPNLQSGKALTDLSLPAVKTRAETIWYTNLASSLSAVRPEPRTMKQQSWSFSGKVFSMVSSTAMGWFTLASPNSCSAAFNLGDCYVVALCSISNWLQYKTVPQSSLTLMLRSGPSSTMVFTVVLKSWFWKSIATTLSLISLSNEISDA